MCVNVIFFKAKVSFGFQKQKLWFWKAVRSFVETAAIGLALIR